MASRVYFRFSSSKDFDFVSFDGEFITVGELKFLISKKTGVLKDRSTVVELFESRTGEEYVNTNTMVPKNASVVAKRSPAVRAPTISAVKKTPPPETPSKSEPKEEEDDGLGPGVFAPEATEDAADAAISELVKGFGEVWRTDLNLQGGWRRGRGREVGAKGRRGPVRMPRSNLPPLGYICHRCNQPGHFIDECPTNGDPAYDFIRVRYPTGIPSSMLVQDEQGGLLMANGCRARLKPNTAKFLQEMKGVPSGEPSVPRLMPPEGEELPDQKFEELSNLLDSNPLACLTPLVMQTLPRARDVDIRRGFFSGEPLDEQTFKECREEHDRAKAAFEGSAATTPPMWTQPPPPSNPPGYNKGQWTQPPPPEFYRDEQWSQKTPPYGEFNPPPQKPVYVDQRPAWNPHMQPPYYDPSPLQGPYPSSERFGPEAGMAYPPPHVDSTPSLHSKVVRLHPHPEEPRPASSASGTHSAEPPPETSHELPYGFERSTQRMVTEQPADRVRSLSRSLERSHRRRSEYRELSDRSPSIKKSKIHKRKEKSHHRRKDKDRHASRKSAYNRSRSPETRRHSRTHQVTAEIGFVAESGIQDGGLDRWELEEPNQELDFYEEAEASSR